MKKKILFIAREKGLFEDLSLLYLMAIAKQEDYNINISKFIPQSHSDIINEIKKEKYDIIAYSSFTGEHIPLINLNREIKKHHSFISIFGGSHSTFSPEIIYESGVDIVCIGEGEIAFREFLRRFAKNQSINNINNLWVKEGDKVIKNPLNNLTEDLDTIPFPERDFFYNKFPQFKYNETKCFICGRGCPFNCSYCFNHIYNKMYKDKGKIIRVRSPENIIKEIEEVKNKYPLKYVHFYDDNLLGYGNEWTTRFFKLYKDKIGLPFLCNVRPDFITEETAEKLEKAGCHCISMGLECGDEDALKLLNRTTSNEIIINTCDILHKHNIKIFTNNLLGLPVDNPVEVDFKTLDLNIRCKPHYAWSSILFPYPKTNIYSYCKKNGYISNSDIVKGRKLSILKFSRKDERKINNLHKLFGIAVNFPFLLPLIKLLIRLPSNKLYNIIFFLWYGYCMEIKTTPFSLFSFKRSVNLFKNFIIYMKESPV